MDYSIDMSQKKANALKNAEFNEEDLRLTNDYINSLSQRNIKPINIENAATNEVLSLTTKDLVCFSFQIARGMEYLASRNVCYFLYMHFCKMYIKNAIEHIFVQNIISVHDTMLLLVF